MASESTLSVVIPVYNGTLFLPELIESLLAQQRRPDEVIFVDDGSTDGSGAMIARLGAGLPGLRVVAQKNQGQAVARNVGMKQATGRYIAFLDADDVVDARMYSILVGLAEDEQLDVAMGNGWNFYEGRKPDTIIYQDVPDTGVITGEEWFQRRWLERYLPHYCWMNVYRRSFIDRHGFEFPLADPHEDVIWVTETLLAAQRFHFVPTPLIRYRKKKILSLPPPVASADGSFRRHKVVESSMYNTRNLCEISGRETLQPLTRKLIRREFVNRGSHLVREIRGLPDPVQKAHYLRRVRQERFFAMLWRNATLSQYWRVLRYHLLAYLLAMAVHLSLLRRRVPRHA
jgi:heptose III glucuronosyltransferase